MTNLINNIFAVDLPYDLTEAIILDGHICDNWADEEYIPIEKLPPGTWQLLFLTRDATDSDWEKMVERDSKYPEWWYKDYELKSPFCYNSTQSGHSLLRSKGLNPDKNYVLIEKIC